MILAVTSRASGRWVGAQVRRTSTPFGYAGASTPFGYAGASTPFGYAGASTPFGYAGASTPFGYAGPAGGRSVVVVLSQMRALAVRTSSVGRPSAKNG
jgi:hypothetical protein